MISSPTRLTRVRERFGGHLVLVSSQAKSSAARPEWVGVSSVVCCSWWGDGRGTRGEVSDPGREGRSWSSQLHQSGPGARGHRLRQMRSEPLANQPPFPRCCFLVKIVFRFMLLCVFSLQWLSRFFSAQQPHPASSDATSCPRDGFAAAGSTVCDQV